MTANMNTCLSRGVWDGILQYYKVSSDSTKDNIVDEASFGRNV
jgi:hypothetical protein